MGVITTMSETALYDLIEILRYTILVIFTVIAMIQPTFLNFCIIYSIGYIIYLGLTIRNLVKTWKEKNQVN